MVVPMEATPPANLKDLDEAFADIIRELRTLFWRGSIPPRGVTEESRRFHPVAVTVRQPGMRMIERSGYCDLKSRHERSKHVDFARGRSILCGGRPQSRSGFGDLSKTTSRTRRRRCPIESALFG